MRQNSSWSLEMCPTTGGNDNVGMIHKSDHYNSSSSSQVNKGKNSQFAIENLTDHGIRLLAGNYQKPMYCQAQPKAPTSVGG